MQHIASDILYNSKRYHILGSTLPQLSIIQKDEKPLVHLSVKPLINNAIRNHFSHSRHISFCFYRNK